MNAVGLFETRTKFSKICAEVARTGVSMLVTRRGKPLVRIMPINPDKTKARSIWDRRAALIKTHGPLTEGFALPTRSKQTWRNPLDN